MSSASTRPLGDVRILAVEQFGAGPWGTMQLADLGADVVKVEDPRSDGDVSRYVPPFQSGEDSLFFESFNRSKRSISLDLRCEAGRLVLADLVPHFDAVFSNLRGDQPERLGLTYDQLHGHNRLIVCCSLSGFGRTGPRAHEGAYDYVLQAMAGWMTLTGEPDGPPTKSGLSLVDLSGGYIAALALIAGIWQARREGRGCDCDLALFDVALSELCYVGTWAATGSFMPERRRESSHPSIVPFQAFQTADDWVTVACAKQKFWVALCRALDCEHLAEDPRFAGMSDRYENGEALLDLLRPLFRARRSEDLLRRLRASRVPASRVNNVLEAFEDPQAEARASIVTYEHPRLGRIREVASPLRLSGDEREYAPAPSRGEHTEAVLSELCGYDHKRLEQLAQDGAFGDVEVLSARTSG